MGLLIDFLDMEERYSLNDCEFEGYNYWTYDRYFVFSYFENCLRGFEDAHEPVKINLQIKRYVSNFLDVIKLQLKRRKLNNKRDKSKFIICKCHSRRNLIDGEMVSIYSDLVLNDMDNVLNYETTYMYTHNKPCYSDNIVYLDLVELRVRLRYVLDKILGNKKNKELRHEIEKKCRAALEELSTTAGIKIDIDSIINKMVKHYIYVREMKKFWYKEFEKYSVSVVINVVGYTPDNMVLSEVAHKNAIPVIELQHGTINEEHVGYNCRVRKEMFPDYILTFGDMWSDFIALEGTKVIPTGFEFFLKERNKYLINVKRKKQIVFISQRNVGDVLYKLALELSNIVEDNHSEWTIIYKLHPSEFVGAKELYPELFKRSNIEVMENEKPLYKLFAESSVQLGYNSTALFEGLGFGLDTYFIENEDKLLRKIVDVGIARFIKNREDLTEIINTDIVKDGNDNIVNVVCKDFVWKENAKSNVQNTIVRIKNKYSATII